MIRFGCASWRLPKTVRARFPDGATLLARYARRLPAVEVNSSFHRHHRHSQYAKWASEVPDGFRIAVKLPRWITHDQRLCTFDGLEDFLAETAGLGDHLGPLLVQLPPSLDFGPDAVEAFLDALRRRFNGAVACEPRHAGWFAAQPQALLRRYRVARVAADPPPIRRRSRAPHGPAAGPVSSTTACTVPRAASARPMAPTVWRRWRSACTRPPTAPRPGASSTTRPRRRVSRTPSRSRMPARSSPAHR